MEEKQGVVVCMPFGAPYVNPILPGTCKGCGSLVQIEKANFDTVVKLGLTVSCVPCAAARVRGKPTEMRWLFDGREMSFEAGLQYFQARRNRD